MTFADRIRFKIRLKIFVFGAMVAGLGLYALAWNAWHHLTGVHTTATFLDYTERCSVEIKAGNRAETPALIPCGEAEQLGRAWGSLAEVDHEEAARIRFTLASGETHEVFRRRTAMPNQNMDKSEEFTIAYNPANPDEIAIVPAPIQLVIIFAGIAAGVSLMLKSIGFSPAAFWSGIAGVVPGLRSNDKAASAHAPPETFTGLLTYDLNNLPRRVKIMGFLGLMIVLSLKDVVPDAMLMISGERAEATLLEHKTQCAVNVPVSGGLPKREIMDCDEAGKIEAEYGPAVAMREPHSLARFQVTTKSGETREVEAGETGATIGLVPGARFPVIYDAADPSSVHPTSPSGAIDMRLNVVGVMILALLFVLANPLRLFRMREEQVPTEVTVPSGRVARLAAISPRNPSAPRSGFGRR